MKILRNILIGIVLGGIFLAGVSKIFFAEEDMAEAAQEQVTEVTLVSADDLSENAAWLVSYGNVEATQDMDLVFQMNGIVEQVYIQPGAWVSEGDVLAVLDNDSLQAGISQAEAAYDAVYWSYRSIADGASYYDYSSARASLEMAEIQLEAMYDAKREAEQAEDGGDIISEFLGNFIQTAPSDTEIEIQEIVVEQYENAIRMLSEGADEETLSAQWAYVEQAEAGLAAARASLEMSYLKAPFSGEVTTLDLDENSYVMATQSVGKIVNRDNVEAVTYLSSDDADSISVGNKVMIDGQYEGYVLGISSRVDDYTNKRKIRIQLDGLYDMTTGDSVEIEIQMDKEDEVTLVPLNSLLFDDEDVYVFFYYDGAVYERKIKTGEILGNYVEVIDMPEIKIVEDVADLQSGQEVSLTQ